MVNDVGIGAEMIRVLMDDVELLCLVKECHELEDGFGSSYTDDLLSAVFVVASLKKDHHLAT